MVAGPCGPLDGTTDQADLECSICCHDYNWTDKCPRELECLHTFCTECLSRLEARPPSSGHHISCPLCRHPTELTASGALGLPRQEQLLWALPCPAGTEARASASRHLILTLDSGRTTVVTLPTVSLGVEREEVGGWRAGAGGTRSQRGAPEPSLFRQSQKQRAALCLRTASVRLAGLVVLACIAAFVFGPHIF